MAKSHYHGAAVRRFFLFGALLMLVALPFFSNRIPAPLMASLGAIIVLGFFAGLMNPLRRWVSAANLVIAIAAAVIFEFQAVLSYPYAHSFDRMTILFLINQILALNFFFAVYVSAKTLRGFFTRGEEN